MRLSFIIAVVLSFAPPVCAQQRAVDFNRDVRPILANHCLKCHGPGEPQRQAGLRVDTKSGLFAPLESGKTAVVPHSSKKSELFRRLVTGDADERMPPADAGPSPELDWSLRLIDGVTCPGRAAARCCVRRLRIERQAAAIVALIF